MAPGKEIIRILSGAVAAVALAGCERGTPTSSDNDAAAVSEGAAIIQARRAQFREMAAGLQAIDRALAEPVPPLPPLRESARRLANEASQTLTWFPAGSGAESGQATGAKAEIWRDPAGFGRAAVDFIAAAEEFNLAARRGDVDAMRAARPALDAACAACHARFLATEEAE